MLLTGPSYLRKYRTQQLKFNHCATLFTSVPWPQEIEGRCQDFLGVENYLEKFLSNMFTGAAIY